MAEENKYFVEFVPSFEKVGRNRSIARYKGDDEFSLKTAREVVKILERRGDKAIKIRKVRD